MGKSELILKKLIEKADNYNDLEFRLLLEEFLKREGKEGEIAFISYLLDKSLNIKIRINFIKVAGYSRKTSFLIPLKNIATSETNIQLQKEAIIAISKYNDKKALNILGMLLEKTNNPTLESVLKSEISKIKQNNPVLSLLPRLVDPTTDKKSLKTIISVLKRIVGPSEAKLFLPYLKIRNREILIAIFEILCYSGDNSLKNIIKDKFKEFYEKIPCKTHIKCDTLYEIFLPYSVYIKRNPDRVFVEELESLYKTSQDNRIIEIVIKLLTSFPYKEAISLLSSIYEEKEEWREDIIMGLEGNEEGAELVIENYKKIKDSDAFSLKEAMIRVLLSTDKGSIFLTENFDELEQTDKILILNNLYTKHYKAFRKIVLTSFTSNDVRIKKVALQKFRENFDFSVENLIKEELKGASVHLEKDILETIKTLFPLYTIYYVFSFIFEKNPSVKKTGELINFVSDVAEFEPVISENHENIIEKIRGTFEMISNSPNKAIVLPFLTLFTKIKFFEVNLYKAIEELVESYVKKRGQKISEGEKLEIKRIKENLSYIGKDLKSIIDGKKYLDIFYRDNNNLDILIKVFNNYPLSAFIHRDEILGLLKKIFREKGESYFEKYSTFFEIHKYISYKIFNEGKDSLLYIEKSQIKPQRIALLFNDKKLIPLLRGQFLLLFSDIELLIGDYSKDDIIITDSSFYLSKKEEFVSKKGIIVILNDIKDSSLIENKFAKMFLPTFSLYRVVKAVIEELF